jgi:hypothetical protein
MFYLPWFIVLHAGFIGLLGLKDLFASADSERSLTGILEVAISASCPCLESVCLPTNTRNRPCYGPRRATDLPVRKRSCTSGVGHLGGRETAASPCIGSASVFVRSVRHVVRPHLVCASSAALRGLTARSDGCGGLLLGWWLGTLKGRP